MRDIGYLELSFRTKVEELIVQCGQKNICMIVYTTTRTPIQQAKYWRQSRTWREIQAAIDKLKEEKAHWLAEILYDVGPQYGRWVSDALPGLSWHQWGEAIDCFSLIKGKANWDDTHNDYRVYAKIATDLGMTAGYNWQKKDAGHVQNRKKKVLECYTLEDVNEIMDNKYNRRKL